MKYINIFIASSIVEFKTERLEIGNFIRLLNDQFVSKGIYFRAIMCEDLSTAIDKERKQLEYNRLIEESQYFYVLFGKEAGEYSIEEFDVAFSHFQACGSPQIYTYFRKLHDDQCASDSVIEFMEHLGNDLKHYYTTYDTIDSVKLHIFLELTRNHETDFSIKLEDGGVFLNNVEMFCAKELPLYSKNDAVKILIAKKKDLEEEYESLVELCNDDPDRRDLAKKLEENSLSRNSINKQLHIIEMDILNLYINNSKTHTAGNELNWREKKAIECFESGDYASGIAILKDKEWVNEIRQVDEIDDYCKASIEQYISGKLTLIKAIKACRVNEKSEQDIIECYEDIFNRAMKYHVCMESLCEYSYFLMYHNRTQDALSISQRLEAYHEFMQTDDLNRADNLYLLSCLLYRAHRIEEAKPYMLRAIEMRKRHFSDGGILARARYAFACNQYARFAFHTKDYETSQKWYEEAIAMQSALAEENPRHKTALALFISNYAQLCEKLGDITKAEEEHKKALDMRIETAKNGEELDIGYLGMSYMRYAIFLGETSPSAQVNDYFEKAIDIYSSLRKQDSTHFKEQLIAQYYYACYLEKTDVDRALSIHQDVLKDREMLYDIDSLAYSFFLAESYTAVGRVLLAKENNTDHGYFEKAYELLKPLYTQEPNKYADIYKKVCEYLNMQE